MMNKAFTLLELLVVMGIMGLLGTISVGGYRAMQRGMEERGVMQSVDSLIRSAYQRAQIDRQPVAVYFWNETLRESTDLESEIVVGKAVAVRRSGRISAATSTMLVDEFGDLNHTYQSKADEEDSGASSSGKKDTMYIYPINKTDVTAKRRTLIRGRVERDTGGRFNLLLENGEEEFGDSGAWGFVVVDKGGVNWAPGKAYGMEFMQLELPHNYIFGDKYSSKVGGDTDSSVSTLFFDVGVNSGDGLTKGGTSGNKTIKVYSLRQDGEKLRAMEVAESANPEKDL